MRGQHSPRTIGAILLVLTLLIQVGLAHRLLNRPVESAPDHPADSPAAVLPQDLAEPGDTAAAVSETVAWDEPTPVEGATVSGDPPRDIGPYLDPDAPVSQLGRHENAEPQDIGPPLDPDAPP
jgi:hypothetical protein